MSKKYAQSKVHRMETFQDAVAHMSEEYPSDIQFLYFIVLKTIAMENHNKAKMALAVQVQSWSNPDQVLSTRLSRKPALGAQV